MKLTQNSLNQLLNNYKIVPIVSAYILGILLNEHSSNAWILAAALGCAAVFISIFFRKSSFLLFIPLGLLFAANSQLISKDNILNYTKEKLDLEGVLYRSPENREGVGSKIYIDANLLIREGKKEPVSGKVIIYANENTESLAYGDTVRFLDIKLSPIENFKNPGSFNLKKYYERQGIYARGFVQGEEQIISFGLTKSYNRILNYIDTLRVKYGNFVRHKFESPQSEILNAITIGEKRGIPQETRDEFSRAGVAHVLAISGLHVGAVALAFFFLIKWLLKRSEYLLIKYQVPRLAAALTILPIFLYTAVAGFSTSTVRAFIMISLYLFSIVIGREEHRLNTLCAAALIILLWHPWSLFELSFQLSFSAVFAILLAHKFYPFKFATLEDKFYSLVKTTIAAGLITFPLVANSFGILPLVSIPANLTIVPLVEFILVPISLVSFIGFLISPHLAETLMSLNIYFIDMLIFSVEMFLKIPYSSLTIPPMNIVSWIVFIILVLSLLANSTYPKFKYLIPLIVVGFIATLVYPLPGKSIGGTLVINFLDVGENRSVVLIELEDSKNILIDGGYSKFSSSGYIEKTEVTNYLLNRGIRNIDLLILSSVDKDHLSGASYLTEKFAVSEIFTNGEKLSGELWGNINEREINWTSLANAEKTIFFNDTKLEIFRPNDDFMIEDSSHPYPVAFKLTHGSSSFLFGESIDREKVQKWLMQSSGETMKSQVLYISHIKNSTTTYEFIETISPEVLIVSNIGDYKQPESNIIVLDTDEVGAVRITSDEKELVLH